MGVSPYVNHLYNDLGAGLVIFQLYDIIRKDIVDWSKVIKSFNKMRIVMEKIGTRLTLHTFQTQICFNICITVFDLISGQSA